MKPEEKSVEEVLKQYWSSAPQEEVEADCNRVLHHLRAAAEHAPKVRRVSSGFLSFFATRIGRVSVAAAVLFVVVIGTTFVRRHPEFAVMENSGATVSIGEMVRADADGSTLVLADGSRVEMRAQSELALEREDDGVRIRLHKGDVIVSAAKQHGHLYVQTLDLKVSVVGTVFLVRADDDGSRVAVLEGEVHVQQGTMEKRLRPGEQVSSNKQAEDLALQVEIGWSHEAAAYLALLHRSLGQKVAARQSLPRPAPVSDQTQFEEASIRPCPQEFTAPQGMRGGGSNSLRLSPGRFDALCMTPATLIRTAYRNLDNNPKLGERLVFDTTYGLGIEDGTRVRGGPDWVRTEKYTFAAVAQGRVDAATLSGPMLLALLQSRFRLKLRVDTEEIPIWALKISESGLKIKPSEHGCFEIPPLRPGSLADEAIMRQLEEARGTKPFCSRSLQPLPPNMRLRVGGSMSQLAEMLSTASGYGSPLRTLSTSLDGRLVLNKTGISDTEIFDFDVEFGADPDAWVEMQQLGFVPGALTLNPLTFKDPHGPTIFDALGQFGLILEKTKASREFIVIEHIERPSPN